jgi:hypothetical protein
MGHESYEGCLIDTSLGFEYFEHSSWVAFRRFRFFDLRSIEL